MPRTRRTISEKGYYHVVSRGMEGLNIFRKVIDFRMFLNMVFALAEEHGIGIIAYCLMEDHFHLLIRDTENQLSKFMSRLLVRYARYYNKKYSHTGRIFYDRFFSRSIDTMGYLLEVYRYILMNPVKAKVCRIDEYRWSSYRDYYMFDPETDIAIIRSMLPTPSLHELFLRTRDTHDPSYYETRPPAPDDHRLNSMIASIADVDSPKEIALMNTEERNDVIRRLRSKGLSIRQIARITGIGRGVIQKIAV
ncbi:MAG: transposase [Clostridiales bacterium]|nr:transposase [Clostridiales bacterium]